MLSIPVKKTDSTKIFKNCEKYIKKNYDKATIEKVRPFLTEGDAFRDQVVATANVAFDGLNSAIQNTARYYRFIKVIENRIPIGSTELKFTWYDSVNRKKFPVLTYKLEKTCLLYNLGALYSRLGAETDLRGNDGHKIALNAFQNAMGCLNEVRKQGAETRLENNIDLTPECLSMNISILTAQCYYIMYDRMDKATGNKINLAKLAYTIHKNFDQAFCASVSLKLARDFQEDFKNMLKFQSLLHLALSSYWMSFPEREEGMKLGTGFGKGVARLRFANENITKAMQTKGLRGAIFESGRNALNMIVKEKELAEGENLSIYMDGIPEARTLSFEELLMVQPKFPPPVDIDSGVTGMEALLCLVPKEVIALCAEYKEILHQLVSVETGRIGDAKREKDQALESMGLPQKINALSSETGLPEAIWKKIQQVQVAGGFFQLENSLTSLRQLCEGCQKSLTDLTGTLTREEDEDKSLRQAYGYQWGRATSQALNAGLRADIDKYHMKLNMAVQLDQGSLRTWQSNQENLELLKRGKNELDTLIPANTEQYNPNAAAELLKQSLDALSNSEIAVNESLKVLIQEVEQDNITEALLRLVEAKLPKESTFNAEIGKFNPKKEEISVKIAELRGSLQVVCEKNSEFERVKGNMHSNPQRVQILTQLELAVKVYNELASILSQGHQFYANLSTHLSVLQQKVADFIYSRNLEKNELITQISGRGGSQGGQPNPYGQFYPQGNPYGQFK